MLGSVTLRSSVFRSQVCASRYRSDPEELGREWSRYDWARYCRSLAEELGPDADSTYGVAKAVSEHITRSTRAIQQYLEVLSLPEEIHPLLTEGPSGTDQQWAAPQNHNPDVRQYNDLQWRVAQEIARGSTDSVSRQIGIAAFAVTFRNVEGALEFVEQALVQPDMRLLEVRRQVEFGTDHPPYLELLRAVRLTDSEKQAVMAHCRRTHQSLSEVIEQSIKEIAASADSG